ncbi:MAG: hypothetical protein H0T62_03110 [Parachlamydiaceae bacterium]|nr:hypothetical protein [Parachlamydiaceae bacterium]
MKSRLFASMAVLFVAAGFISSCCSNNDCCDPCPPRACRPVCCPKPTYCPQPCPPPCAPCPPRCEPMCY